MAEPGSTQQPKRPNSPAKNQGEALRKPLQVLHISKKSDQISSSRQESLEEKPNEKQHKINKDESKISLQKPENLFKNYELDQQAQEEVSMADLMGSPEKINPEKQDLFPQRSVDDFDFDEDAFLAALDENEPIGTTGEIANGEVIGVESDGVYVDIGGKAPGFMPKSECALGVITNIKEKFPKGLQVEVLVTRDQNADGIVTISCRALALRKSWDKIKEIEKEGKVVKVQINGFNRGGLICDLEGLRGFIPRSHLIDGENHESLVGKKIEVAFLEVNPETRKLVLSEKRAVIVARFAELEIGQLVEGTVSAIKQYGFFIDLGGISALLHKSTVTNGNLRSLREVFKQGDQIKALITELDQSKGRISLSTAILEGPPGEILEKKSLVMEEAEERANKARKILFNEKNEPQETQESKEN
tara:strand:+ start:649 stop:1902 length:1254 start_codon:yes stop_codon:yes gene_type:complete